MKPKKAIVIGAGLGGLSAAIYLAQMGWEVHVFEKNETAGGKAGQIQGKGFRFDAGPSLLTMPFVLEAVFRNAGEDIQSYLDLRKLEVICKYFYPDGTIFNAFSDLQKLAPEAADKFDVSETDIFRYFDYCKNIYDLTAELFLEKSFTEPATFLNKKALKTLLSVRKIDTLRTMHRANASFFSDARLVQLFDRYATYNGSNPYKAPATLNIIQHVEYGLGGFLPAGGIIDIPKALQKLAEKKGVHFHFNAPVEKILVDKGNIIGILCNDQNEPADVVVSNADVNFTYQQLLKDEHSRPAKRYQKLEKSTSALVFYWGVKGVSDLDTHNILFSSQYQQEFEQLFDWKIVPMDPTIYIYISSKINPADAPTGCENWFVMINTPCDQGRNWQTESQRIREVIIRKIEKHLNFPLEKNILFEENLTPQKIAMRTNSPGGSIYGISSNNRISAFLRQQNRSKIYKGLYFCGGSAHPGGGIPLALLSGKICSELIGKYEM